jgi:hypothetical protein
MSWRLGKLVVIAWLCAATVACGSGDERAAGTPDASGGVTPATAPDAGFCSAQPCACSGAVGTRRCDATGVLGACDCPVPAATTLDAAVINIGICPTGRYEGNFGGEAGFLFALGSVSGLDLWNEQPPLQITLSRERGDEFAVSGNGMMRGTANGAFPFEAMITGKLNCETKRFQARLVGSVQLVFDGVRNDFTGTMESLYDPQAQAFTGGTWTVTGSDADGGFDLGLNGEGSWSAQHVPDAGSDAGR